MLAGFRQTSVKPGDTIIVHASYKSLDGVEGGADTVIDVLRELVGERGPVFLSGNGLWMDWRDNWALNRAIEKSMMRFEGEHSVFDIAKQVGLDYWMVRDYVEKFRAKGFVKRLPIPSEAESS